MSDFSQLLIVWQKQHGRHDLPWQNTTDPYRVWLSEIMLQQTQVRTVLPYYERFLARFPTLANLAAAETEQVMALWSGLGYYARARHLHLCAQRVMREHCGSFPSDPTEIEKLPGIGRSTANAIAVFCFGARAPILDGNVRRVLCRCFGIEGFPSSAAITSSLWQLADSLLPDRDVSTYIQAQMDLGAAICTRRTPKCDKCPLATLCVARRDGRCTELPWPRPRRTLSKREAVVLILFDGKQVLLELRQSSGIWGGLLSLPEVADCVEAETVARRLGLATLGFEELEPLEHSFTHFHLAIRPLLAVVQSRPSIDAANGWRWLTQDELPSAALPSPIRKLLEKVFAGLQ